MYGLIRVRAGVYVGWENICVNASITREQERKQQQHRIRGATAMWTAMKRRTRVAWREEGPATGVRVSVGVGKLLHLLACIIEH